MSVLRVSQCLTCHLEDERLSGVCSGAASCGREGGGAAPIPQEKQLMTGRGRCVGPYSSELPGCPETGPDTQLRLLVIVNTVNMPGLAPNNHHPCAHSLGLSKSGPFIL